MMDIEKTITFGIWGEMGIRNSIKANIMSVKINDSPSLQNGEPPMWLSCFTSCVHRTFSVCSPLVSAFGQWWAVSDPF